MPWLELQVQRQPGWDCVLRGHCGRGRWQSFPSELQGIPGSGFSSPGKPSLTTSFHTRDPVRAEFPDSKSKKLQHLFQPALWKLHDILPTVFHWSRKTAWFAMGGTCTNGVTEGGMVIGATSEESVTTLIFWDCFPHSPEVQRCSVVYTKAHSELGKEPRVSLLQVQTRSLDPQNKIQSPHVYVPFTIYNIFCWWWWWWLWLEPYRSLDSEI